MIMGVAAMTALYGRIHRAAPDDVLDQRFSYLFMTSMVGMLVHWWRTGPQPALEARFALFLVRRSSALSILGVTIRYKLLGGYVTILVTGTCIALALAHSPATTTGSTSASETERSGSPTFRPTDLNIAEPDPAQPTAIILVGSYGGLGIHTMLSAIRFSPGYYKNVVIAVQFWASSTRETSKASKRCELRHHAEETLAKPVDLASRLGLASTSFMSIGTDPVEELEHLCVDVHKRFPRSTIFATANSLVSRDSIYQRLFHNQTAFFAATSPPSGTACRW